MKTSSNVLILDTTWRLMVTLMLLGIQPPLPLNRMLGEPGTDLNTVTKRKTSSFAGNRNHVNKTRISYMTFLERLLTQDCRSTGFAITELSCLEIKTAYIFCVFFISQENSNSLCGT
jgi:hypothetical protein